MQSLYFIFNVSTYRELKTKSIGHYNERGSKFIAYALPVYSQEEAKHHTDNIKKLEPSASHYCYAFVLNPDKSIIKKSDDGEPSSSAGKPILGQILSNDLTNTLIIVARYYGGTKLGLSGLINAYKRASRVSISKTRIITKNINIKYEIFFKYAQINTVMCIIKKYKLEIIEKEIQLESKIIFAVKKNHADLIVKKFKDIYQLRIKITKENI